MSKTTATRYRRVEVTGPSSAAVETVSLAHRYVTLGDGVRVHYVEAGLGKPLLLIPGWMATTRFWEPQLHYFARRYRTIAMDPRSQGESTKTPDGNCIDQRARDVHELLNCLALGPAVIIAWSMAVADVLSMANQFGDADIRALVLVDGPIVAWTHDRDMQAQLVAGIKRIKTARREFTAELVKRLFRKPQSEAREQDLIAEMLKTPADTAIMMQLDSLQFDFRGALRRLERPVMFVGRGEQPGLQVEVFRSTRPHDRVEILPNCGHALFLDDPERFHVAVEDFLGGALTH